MESLNLETGTKRIAINGDPGRIIKFNPRDVLFAKKFYKLIEDFKIKLAEYDKKIEDLDANQDTDELGIPVRFQDRLDLLIETSNWLRERIDWLFGEGTSKIAFGDEVELELFEQFFDGITPFISEAREEKIKPYINTATRQKRKVMK